MSHFLRSTSVGNHYARRKEYDVTPDSNMFYFEFRSEQLLQLNRLLETLRFLLD